MATPISTEQRNATLKNLNETISLLTKSSNENKKYSAGATGIYTNERYAQHQYAMKNKNIEADSSVRQYSEALKVIKDELENPGKDGPSDLFARAFETIQVTVERQDLYGLSKYDVINRQTLSMVKDIKGMYPDNDKIKIMEFARGRDYANLSDPSNPDEQTENVRTEDCDRLACQIIHDFNEVTEGNNSERSYTPTKTDKKIIEDLEKISDSLNYFAQKNERWGYRTSNLSVAPACAARILESLQSDDLSPFMRAYSGRLTKALVGCPIRIKEGKYSHMYSGLSSTHSSIHPSNSPTPNLGLNYQMDLENIGLSFNDLKRAAETRVKVEPAKSKEAPESRGKYTLDEPTKPAPKKEAPKKETPKKETPKAEAPKKETPKAEAPKKEAPKAEAPKKETPKAEAPKKEEPKVEAPKKETPKAEAPKKETPKAEAPKKEAPKPKAPAPKDLDVDDGPLQMPTNPDTFRAAVAKLKRDMSEDFTDNADVHTILDSLQNISDSIDSLYSNWQKHSHKIDSGELTKQTKLVKASAKNIVDILVSRSGGTFGSYSNDIMNMLRSGPDKIIQGKSLNDFFSNTATKSKAKETVYKVHESKGSIFTKNDVPRKKPAPKVVEGVTAKEAAEINKRRIESEKNYVPSEPKSDLDTTIEGFEPSNYKKEFAAVLQDLRKTDSAFSNDSKEYKEFKSSLTEAVSNMAKKDPNENNIADFLKEAQAAAQRYRVNHATALDEGKPLSNRQLDRLKVMARLDNLCEMAEKYPSPSHPEVTKARIAEKIATGSALSHLKGNFKNSTPDDIKTAQQSLLNRKNMRDSIDHVMQSDNFKKYVGNTPSKDMLKVSGTKLVDDFNKQITKNKTAGGPTM